MAHQTDVTRATSQGRAAALTVLLDEAQAETLRSMGFGEEWRDGPGADADLPENPYAGGALAEAWQDGFDRGMENRHLS